MNPKADELLREGMRKVAPGTRLREGIDAIIAARAGALVVIGDEARVAPLCNGGFQIDTPFTPQRMFEVAKMDGAIILDPECERILKANVHLVPSADLPTSETGMRHRTAERVSRQTQALVIAISQRREVVNLYVDGRRLTLEDIEVVLAKANQALATLERYRTRLDIVLERLSGLEFDDLVTVGDVIEAIARFEMVRRVAREVRRYIAQLGTEGRLVAMQAEELNATVEEHYILVLRDYVADPLAKRLSVIRDALASLSTDQLMDADSVAPILGMSPISRHAPEEHAVARGYRALARLPQLPVTVVNRIVDRFGSLPAIARASIEDLDEVDGVGARRANAISAGLIRMRVHMNM